MWNLERFSNNAALIAEERTLTYKELGESVALFSRNIEKRSLVFILCENVAAALVGYVGCIEEKNVPVMLDSELDRQLLENLISLYAPKYIWLPEEKTGGFSDYQRIFSFGGYFLLAKEDGSSFALHDDLALLMTTSGSTGSPKLVRQSYDNITANTKSIVEYLAIDENERAITSLPMNYVYGLSVINTHLYAGASIVLTEKSLFQREFWQLFQEYKVTSLNGVPYTYEMLNKLRFFKRDLPHLRTLTQAGGKLNKELHKKFAEYAEKNGKRFFVMYGAAEAASRMGYLPYRDSLKKCGSMGIAIPGGRFELVDETGGAIEGEGQIGELVYYGRNVMLGYAERGEDLCRGDECHGRLCTGDLAVRDADGYYTVVGRKKRFLKIFGKRVNLSETEDLLKIKFPDLEIACAGIDDRVYIFTTDSRFLDEITDFISAKLALHRSAFKATYIEEIPKNKAGKTSYKELEKYYD